jgi:hypothetical protein
MRPSVTLSSATRCFSSCRRWWFPSLLESLSRRWISTINICTCLMRSIRFESDVAGFGGVAGYCGVVGTEIGAGEKGWWVGIGFATYGYGNGVGWETDMGVRYWGLTWTLLKLIGCIGIRWFWGGTKTVVPFCDKCHWWPGDSKIVYRLTFSSSLPYPEHHAKW